VAEDDDGEDAEEEEDDDDESTVDAGMNEENEDGMLSEDEEDGDNQAAAAAPGAAAAADAAATAAAVAIAAAAAAEEEAEEPVSSVEDVWVDSYLCCAADEVFVCVRDCRTTAEVPSAKTQALARCGSDAGEGALLGDGTTRGCTGVVGRFATGDSGSDLPAATNDADPGQPVRPPHRGWLFKVAQASLLQGVVDRVRSELLPTPEPKAYAHQAESDERVARGEPPLPPTPPQLALKWETEGDLLSPPNQLLYFVAVAPQFHAASAAPAGGVCGYASLRSHDTPAGATLRAAFGVGPHPAQRAAAVAECAPLHILELHDLQSYITHVWAPK
jgi:hypothetical protein